MSAKDFLSRLKQSFPLKFSALVLALFTGISYSPSSSGVSSRTEGDWELKGSCNYRWNTVWENPLFSIWRHKDSKEFAIDLFDAQNLLTLEYRDFECAYFQLHRDGLMLVLSRFIQNNYVGVILEKNEATNNWERTEIHCEMAPKTVAPNINSSGSFMNPTWIDEIPCAP